MHLSAEQRALLREFEESLRREGSKHAPRQKSFLDGVKRFFSAAVREPTGAVTALAPAAGPGGAIPTVLIGATGRMGVQHRAAAAASFPQLELCGAMASERSAALGEDAAARLRAAPPSGVTISAALPPLLRRARSGASISPPRVRPRPTWRPAWPPVCRCCSEPAGWRRSSTAPLARPPSVIALLVAPNTSLGRQPAAELVRAAAQALPAGYDIEIVEAHHRAQGAMRLRARALALGAAAARGARWHAREHGGLCAPWGPGSAPARGRSASRRCAAATWSASTRCWFLGEGERLVLRHRRRDRAVFARGALLAGQWLARQAAGTLRNAGCFFLDRYRYISTVAQEFPATNRCVRRFHVIYSNAKIRYWRGQGRWGSLNFCP